MCVCHVIRLVQGPLYAYIILQTPLYIHKLFTVDTSSKADSMTDSFLIDLHGFNDSSRLQSAVCTDILMDH